MERLTYRCPLCHATGEVALLGPADGSFTGRCRHCRGELEFLPARDGRATARPLAGTSRPQRATAPAPPSGAADPEPGSQPNGPAPPESQPPAPSAPDAPEPVPADYPPYTGPALALEAGSTWLIGTLILTAALLGLATAGVLYAMPAATTGLTQVEVTLVVRNATGPLANVTLEVDGTIVELTPQEPGVFNFTLATGVHRLEVSAPGHRSAWAEIYLANQDASLEETEGVSRFTFILTEGEGAPVEQELADQQRMWFWVFRWCPPLGVLFSLLGLMGAWAAFTRRSYVAAQLGALCSIFAVGLFLGAVLGLLALGLLHRQRKLFPGPFNTGNLPPPWN